MQLGTLVNKGFVVDQGRHGVRGLILFSIVRMLGQRSLVEQIVILGVAPGYVPWGLWGLWERGTQTVYYFDCLEVAEAVAFGRIANDRA
jgi:hypothetical protein